MELGFWIPIVSEMLNSLSFFPDSKVQSHRFYKQKLPGFRNPDSPIRHIPLFQLVITKGYTEYGRQQSIDGQNAFAPSLRFKTRVIRIRVIEGPNAHDQIALCAFHSFLVKIQTNAYIPRMRNNNLEIRIADDKGAILISRLLLRMRRMYVASIRLDLN